MPATHDPMDMTGRMVIVTGGTKGLGRVMAEKFLEHGAEVLICARNPPENPVEARQRSATFVAADVRDPHQVAEVVAAARSVGGGIDVLVNNAGGAPPVATAGASPRFNEKVIALNLLAPLTMAQAVQPVMSGQSDGGVIINIASVSGTRPNPSAAAYGAAKAGLINLTGTLAHEWGPAIRVVAVVVGFVLTDRAHLFYGDADGIDAVGRTLALERLADPAEIATAVLFLASPLASYISGTALEVHGGGEQPAYLSASTGEVARRGDPNPSAGAAATSEPATGEQA